MPFISTFSAFSIKGFGGGLSNPLFGGTGMVGLYSGSLVKDIAIDSLGNLYGIYDSSYLFKYSPEGDLLFWKTIKAGPTVGDPNAIMNCMAIDSSDQIYLGTTNTGIIKVNSSGVYLYCYNFGYTINSIQITGSNLYAGGGIVLSMPKDTTTGQSNRLYEYLTTVTGLNLFVDVSANRGYMYVNNRHAEVDLTITSGNNAGNISTVPLVIGITYNGTFISPATGQKDVNQFRTTDGFYSSSKGSDGTYNYYMYNKVFGSTSTYGTNFGFRTTTSQVIDGFVMANDGTIAVKVDNSLYFMTQDGWRKLTWNRLGTVYKIVISSGRIGVIAQSTSSPYSGVVFSFPSDGKLMSRGSFIVDGEEVTYTRTNFPYNTATCTMGTSSTLTFWRVESATPIGTAINTLTTNSTSLITTTNLPEP